MERRYFLKQSLFASVGGLLLPSVLLSSCRRKDPFSDLEYTGKVVVIGAGASGLYAAYLLKSKGVDVQVLEASSVYGGRLAKLEGFADYPLDLGAQWLHGKNNLIADLVVKTQTTITKDESELKYWFNNELRDLLPENPDIFHGKQMPDVSYKDYAASEGLGPEYQYIVEGIAGDQGAPASRLSVYWNDKDEENWVSGDTDYKFEGTYYDLIDQQIAAVVKDIISLNTVVKQIDYTNDRIFITDQNNQVIVADKVIITVPITVLKSEDIEFVPALPQEKLKAFSKFGMDPGMKVFLKFTDRFYDENIIGGRVCGAYAAEHIGKTGNDNVLLAFIMGEQALAMNTLPNEDEIVKSLLAELDGMYDGKASAAFIAAHVQDWGKHPYIRGAYAYSMVGMGDARVVASEPLNDRIYFAGEAMNTNGHHQTVQGAVESAYQQVMNVLKSVKNA